MLHFTLPQELADLLHQLLKIHCHLGTRPGVKNLFVSPTGLAFSSSNFNSYWKGILIDGEAAAVFPPRLLRHCFVDERMDPEAVPGPSPAGAAMVMGE